MKLKGKVIVANTGDDTLTYIDIEDRKVIETVDLKKIMKRDRPNTLGPYSSFIGPYDLAYNGKNYIYCTNAYNNSVFKMNLESKEIVDILHVGSFPTCIKYFKNHLFITNSDSNSISVIDENQFTLLENIPVGEKPSHIEIDKDSMYVVNSNGYSINVIDLKGVGNKIIRLKNNPVKLFFMENQLYVLSNIDNGGIYYSNISIIDLRSYEIKESKDFKGNFSNMLKINGNEIIFITNINDGYLYRMDIKSKKLISKTYLAGMPNKLERDRENILLISNISTNMLTLFNIESNSIIDNIKVGLEPNGILVL
ncbi:MAG: YncE family protein [Tissierellia bacterium]|nr:YncE family protein [Tissierellia bacterium]